MKTWILAVTQSPDGDYDLAYIERDEIRFFGQPQWHPEALPVPEGWGIPDSAPRVIEAEEWPAAPEDVPQFSLRRAWRCAALRWSAERELRGIGSPHYPRNPEQ